MDALWKEMLIAIDRDQVPVNQKVRFGVRNHGQHAVYEAWSEFLELLGAYERIDNQLNISELMAPPILDTRLILMEGVVNMME